MMVYAVVFVGSDALRLSSYSLFSLVNSVRLNILIFQNVLLSTMWGPFKGNTISAVLRGKMSLAMPIRLDSNRTAEPQKLARGLQL